MKKIIVRFAVLFLVVALLTGCDMPYGGPVEHTFLQSRENVVKVEICTNSNSLNWRKGAKIDSLHTLVELSAEEIDSLWNELLTVDAVKLKFVSYGCGDLVFVFTYADGQQELIGYSEIAVLNADGTFLQYRYHVLYDTNAITELFAKYADPELLKEVSEFFRSYYH